MGPCQSNLAGVRVYELRFSDSGSNDSAEIRCNGPKSDPRTAPATDDEAYFVFIGPMLAIELGEPGFEIRGRRAEIDHGGHKMHPQPHSSKIVSLIKKTVHASHGSQRMEALGGIEPPIKVLQTLALPLGYGATL